MWFVFPQLVGLGTSATAQRFAIGSLGEARCYLDHAELGPRLVECAGIVAESPCASAAQLFGEIDALKLRSSMTLFLRARRDEERFAAVLTKYFDGKPDPATDQILSEHPR